MRSDELRQFAILRNGSMVCPGCWEKIPLTNLDQAVKAAKRHSKRHAEAERNIVAEGDINGLAGFQFSNMSSVGMRGSVDGFAAE